MITALILAYDFPPLLSAGAQRPWSWVKYLPEFGISPVVITREWEIVNNGVYTPTSTGQDFYYQNNIPATSKVIRAKFLPSLNDKIIMKYGKHRYVVVRKCISFIWSILRFYHPSFDNTYSIYREAYAYLETNRCDVIIATGEPFILFRHANKLWARFNIPYILDYRDGWTHGLAYGIKAFMQKIAESFLLRKLEHRYLRSAKAVTAASETYLKDFQDIHNNGRYFEVLNGYFEECFAHENFPRNNKLQILYSGTLYAFQPLERFLETLDICLAKVDKLEVHLIFLGGNEDGGALRSVVKKLTCKRLQVEIMPRLPHPLYAEMLVSSDVLLLLGGKNGWLNAKIFDYLRAERNILLFEAQGDRMENIISNCEAGHICHNENELENALFEIFKEYMMKGYLPAKTNNYQQYSRKAQAEKLSKIILQCVE